MKFLVDECLSTRLVRFLAAAGHDAIHVDDHDLAGRPDEEVLAKAVSDSRVLLSADTDFGEILARSNDPTPSVILFRRSDRSANTLAEVLLANLDTIAKDLERGAFVVITEDRLRIRTLPIGQ
jgi:predicted nuclease of predicted toxin-antitoxin system